MPDRILEPRRPPLIHTSRTALIALAGLSAALFATCGSIENPDLPFSGSSVATDTQGASLGTPGAGSNTPTTSDAVQNNVGTPAIAGPLPGEQADRQPTLTVRNAASLDGSTLTYDFQIATDTGFDAPVTERIGLPEGNDGTTSWRVESPLPDARYFWRARGVGAQGPGPYTPTSDFFVGAGGSPPGSPTPPPPPPPPSGGGFVIDPLTNGTSVGEVGGGRFIGSGWQVTSRGDYIRYRIPPTSSGFVEWENLGLSRFNPQADLFSLFGMWDPTAGDYRENPFRVHVRKLDTQGHNPPYLRMRFISQGDQRDVGFDFLDWVPSRAYRFRVEWGPAGSGNEARVLLDGRVVIRTGYGPAYRPEQHWVELGVEERAESIVGVIYRNVRIGPR